MVRRRGVSEKPRGSFALILGVGVALVLAFGVGVAVSRRGGTSDRDPAPERAPERTPTRTNSHERAEQHRAEEAERRRQAERELDQGARAQRDAAASPPPRPRLPETPEEEEAFVTVEAKKRIAGFVRDVHAQGGELSDADLQPVLDREKRVVRRTLESMRRIVRVGLANGYTDREITEAFDRASRTVLAMQGADGSLAGGIGDEDAAALDFLQRARREGGADAQLDRLK